MFFSTEKNKLAHLHFNSIIYSIPIDFFKVHRNRSLTQLKPKLSNKHTLTFFRSIDQTNIALGRRVHRTVRAAFAARRRNANFTAFGDAQRIIMRFTAADGPDVHLMQSVHVQMVGFLGAVRLMRMIAMMVVLFVFSQSPQDVIVRVGCDRCLSS